MGTMPTTSKVGSAGPDLRAAGPEPVRVLRSSEWTLTVEGGVLVAHAGADHRFAFDDCPQECTAELMAPVIEMDLLTAPAVEAARGLLTLGALRPVLAGPDACLEVAVICAGFEPAGWFDLLQGAAGPQVTLVSDPQQARLVLVARFGGTLRQTADRAPVAAPHLLFDAAYHHTLTLGPLVVPGQTACLSCLFGRLEQRWGDAEPPERPRASRWTGLGAAWVAAELDSIAAGTSRLVNRSVSFDVEAHRMREEALLRLPWCLSCADVPGSGALELPWVPSRGEPEGALGK